MKRIFISYSHRDETWKDLLVTQLKGLQMQGYWEVWEDRDIKAGEEWNPKIETAINNSDAAILLITANFLASDFIILKEVPLVLRRRVGKKMHIFPLIVSPCTWKQAFWLPLLQVRPKDGKPLSSFNDHERDSALADFALEIKDILAKDTPPESLKGIDETKILSMLDGLSRKVSPSRSDVTGEGDIKVSISKLPTTRSLLLGREEELDTLDRAWADDRTRILTLVAWGGVGKTALVNQWLNHMEEDRFRGAQRVYAWSFYSQGTSVDRQTSADEFIHDALTWFGDPDPKKGAPWDKGKRLADLVRQKKTLLILDGMEPLQYPPGEMQGRLKDQALQALLKELAGSHPGLCVLTTRVKVEDLEHAVGASVKRVCLEHLPTDVGADLLKHHGVKGSDRELLETSEAFRGHALALNLLGRFLAVVHKGDIRKKDRVPRLTEEEKEGGHAKRVMESYERFLSGKPESNILYLLGLFDRPAEKGAVDALRAEPAIEGLTAELQDLSDAQWQYALTHLRDLDLLAGEEEHRPDVLDCHPLVREHFGEKLQKSNPGAWKEAHSRLYEYYKKVPDKKNPDTLKELEPLFIAVNHGCLAGRHQEAFDNVFLTRIRRGNELYSLKKLGAFGSHLAALSGFFEITWKKPTSGLNKHIQSVVLNEAGFCLRALGRLREAAQPMEAALDLVIEKENWKQSAIAASNLSELYLTLGEVSRAVEAARKSVALADKSGDVFEQYSDRTTLADALHQAGETTEAGTLFREAEEMQKKDSPEYPFLYSLQGYQYCDLLLGHGGPGSGGSGGSGGTYGQYAEVQKRAEKALEIVLNGSRNLLDIALNKLSLGRAHWLQALEQGARGTPAAADFTAALEYLDRAVTGLRDAAHQEFLSRGLLARAAVFRTMKAFSNARENLEEARDIAERGNMNLFLADYHLEAARVGIEEKNGHWEKTLEHFNTAKKMINEMGYHRRDWDVEELEKQLNS